MAVTTGEQCPYCGSKITNEKFLKVQGRIRDEERRKLAAAVEQVKVELEKQRKKELAEVRQILAKDRDAALAKREAEFARERDALQKKIVDISKRVTKSGGDIGEGSELDLYDELRTAFPEDMIARKGPNLIVELRDRKSTRLNS